MRQTAEMLSSESGMNEEPMMSPLEEEEEPMPMPSTEEQQPSPPTGLMSRRGAM